MSAFSLARSFRELVVYQKSRLLAREIYMHTKFFPRDEMTALTGSIRRSSRSIGAQIIQAWAHRDEEALFVSRLTDADAEQVETQHWIEIASDCGYIDQDAGAQLVKRCSELGRMLNAMIARAELICDPAQTIRAETVDFFIGAANWTLPINNEQVE